MRKPHPDEARVGVAATAVCHSDIHDRNGDFGGSICPQVDIPATSLISLYRAGRHKLDELISGRYPLAQINEAIASLRGETLRNVIVFG